jgi:hypothetical protein
MNLNIGSLILPVVMHSMYVMIHPGKKDCGLSVKAADQK